MSESMTARWLLGPHPRITDPDGRTGARLVATMMLFHFSLILLVTGVLEFVWRERFGRSLLQGDNKSWIPACGAATILLAYGLVRTGLYRAGALLYIGCTAAVGVLAPFSPAPTAEIGMLAASTIPVLITAIFFSERWILAGLAAITSAILIQLITTDLSPRRLQTGVALTAVFVITGLLLVVFRRYQRLLEARHLAGTRDSEAAYRALFESITDGVLIVELGGKILEANQTACLQFGYPHDELLTKSVYEITTLSPSAGMDLRQQGLGGKRLGFEITCRRKDGALVPIELAVSPIQFKGRPALVSSGRDLTERKRAEQERLRLEDKLRESAKLESIGMLAGGVAHDFNNLLTAILGNVSLAEDPSLPAHVSDSLREIHRAAESAAALTRQLLAFSRRQVIEPRVIDLGKHLASLRKMLVRLIGEDIELSTVLATDLHLVKVDPGVVEQIVVNLVVNARDAMPDGGRLIIETANVTVDHEFCERHPTLGPGDYVMLAVADTGVGMPPEVKARLFEPFFTTKGHGRGTGLGLATTYGAVRQSGGEIDVNSELGQGTSFKIYLPRAVGCASAESGRTHVPAQGGDETVLLVEDDAAIRRLAELALASAGYRVLTAESGEQALRLALARPLEVQALVTDVVLPGINGRKLADVLRQRNDKLKVLYTSGYTGNVIGHHGVLDESLAFLPKPYAPRDLLARLRRVIDAPA